MQVMIAPILAASLAVLGTAGSVAAESVHTDLTGYEETPLTISTTGNGQFRAEIRDEDRIEWELSYADLKGSVLQAHIHFGARAITGGISAFFCTNLGNGPAGTQLCPASPATISGTIRAADVIGPAGQGIEAGAFAELVQAIRAGVAYANVHSSKWPGGEIRGHLNGSSRD